MPPGPSVSGRPVGKVRTAPMFRLTIGIDSHNARSPATWALCVLGLPWRARRGRAAGHTWWFAMEAPPPSAWAQLGRGSLPMHWGCILCPKLGLGDSCPPDRDLTIHRCLQGPLSPRCQRPVPRQHPTPWSSSVARHPRRLAPGALSGCLRLHLILDWRGLRISGKHTLLDADFRFCVFFPHYPQRNIWVWTEAPSWSLNIISRTLHPGYLW